MERLSESNPELFENERLGEASPLPFLDQMELQKQEDYSARIEGRTPRVVIAEDRFPHLPPSGTVPSSIAPKLSYAEEKKSPKKETSK